MKQSHDREKKPYKAISYASKQERQCSVMLQKFCNWKPVFGRTYQRPITRKHSADFFIPESNVILEWHPPVIKWYGAPSVFNRLKRLNSQLSDREQAEVQDLICSQITHEYFKRRRALMDMSDLPDVKQMRLVVCADWSDLYQMIIKPFANETVNFTSFKNALEAVK